MEQLRIANFLSPLLEPVYRLVAEEVGREFDVPVEFVNGRSFSQFASDEVDAGFI